MHRPEKLIRIVLNFFIYFFYLGLSMHNFIFEMIL